MSVETHMHLVANSIILLLVPRCVLRGDLTMVTTGKDGTAEWDSETTLTTIDDSFCSCCNITSQQPAIVCNLIDYFNENGHYLLSNMLRSNTVVFLIDPEYEKAYKSVLAAIGTHFDENDNIATRLCDISTEQILALDDDQKDCFCRLLKLKVKSTPPQPRPQSCLRFFRRFFRFS